MGPGGGGYWDSDTSAHEAWFTEVTVASPKYQLQIIDSELAFD